MGIFDALLGGRRKLKLPAEDRLFAMSTAQVTIESIGLKHKPVAGIAFQSLATADFKQIVADTEELLRSSAQDSGSRVDTSEDEYGYRWVLLHDDDFDDLVVSLNTVSSSLEGGGYGDRVLAAVFAFQEEGRPIYFIYNYRRGFWYPFVPAPGEKQRNNERELQLKAQVGPDLPWEPELTRWFPLWDLPF